MVWYNLFIGKWKVKYMPLNPQEQEYENCDEKGSILKKVSGKYDKGFFVNEATGEQHTTAFKLIKGKPFAKLPKTKEVNNYKEVDLREVDDLLVERKYIIECDNLLDELQDSGKALKFGFSNGNGFKVFKAYIHTSSLYKGYLFMSLERTQISEIIQEIEEIKSHKKKAEQVTLTIQGIDRAKVEDLIEL